MILGYGEAITFSNETQREDVLRSVQHKWLLLLLYKYQCTNSNL
jgi:hypothetical protein